MQNLCKLHFLFTSSSRFINHIAAVDFIVGTIYNQICAYSGFTNEALQVCMFLSGDDGSSSE
jgi:hypothetical protein